MRFKKLDDSEDIYGVFQSISDLIAFDTTVIKNFSKAYVEGFGEFVFRKSSTMIHDGDKVIKPVSDIGRWLRISKPNLKNSLRMLLNTAKAQETSLQIPSGAKEGDTLVYKNNSFVSGRPTLPFSEINVSPTNMPNTIFILKDESVASPNGTYSFGWWGNFTRMSYGNVDDNKSYNFITNPNTVELSTLDFDPQYVGKKIFMNIGDTLYSTEFLGFPSYVYEDLYTNNQGKPVFYNMPFMYDYISDKAHWMYILDEANTVGYDPATTWYSIEDVAVIRLPDTFDPQYVGKRIWFIEWGGLADTSEWNWWGYGTLPTNYYENAYVNGKLSPTSILYNTGIFDWNYDTKVGSPLNILQYDAGFSNINFDTKFNSFNIRNEQNVKNGTSYLESIDISKNVTIKGNDFSTYAPFEPVTLNTVSDDLLYVHLGTFHTPPAVMPFQKDGEYVPLSKYPQNQSYPIFIKTLMGKNDYDGYLVVDVTGSGSYAPSYNNHKLVCLNLVFQWVYAWDFLDKYRYKNDINSRGWTLYTKFLEQHEDTIYGVRLLYNGTNPTTLAFEDAAFQNSGTMSLNHFILNGGLRGHYEANMLINPNTTYVYFFDVVSGVWNDNLNGTKYTYSQVVVNNEFKPFVTIVGYKDYLIQQASHYPKITNVQIKGSMANNSYDNQLAIQNLSVKSLVINGMPFDPKEYFKHKNDMWSYGGFTSNESTYHLNDSSYSTSFGFRTSVHAKSAFVTGEKTTVSGKAAFASGINVYAIGVAAFNHSVTTEFNVTGASGDYSAILGGINHTIHPSANNSAIIGGQSSIISNSAQHSVIIGGSNNYIATNILRSVVLGGENIYALANDTVYVQNLVVYGNIKDPWGGNVIVYPQVITINGTKNGTNKAFTYSTTIKNGSIQLYRNGLILSLTTDFTINYTNKTITFIVAPQSTDKILAYGAF
jgi:hypothetical protein